MRPQDYDLPKLLVPEFNMLPIDKKREYLIQRQLEDTLKTVKKAATYYIWAFKAGVVVAIWLFLRLYVGPSLLS
jgi:hypothetical protein